MAETPVDEADAVITESLIKIQQPPNFSIRPLGKKTESLDPDLLMDGLRSEAAQPS